MELGRTRSDRGEGTRCEWVRGTRSPIDLSCCGPECRARESSDRDAARLTDAARRTEIAANVKNLPVVGLLALACSFLSASVACAPDGEVVASPRLPRLLSKQFPLRLECAGGELTLEVPPRRVLPANATWVDFVSLLVGPERVAALPAEASGYSRLGSSSGAWAELAPYPVFEGER